MTNESNPNQQPGHQSGHEHESAPDQAALSPRKALVGVAVVVIVAGILAGIGIWSRIHADNALVERTNALALFPRLGAASQPIAQSPAQKIRHAVSRSVIRGVARLTDTK